MYNFGHFLGTILSNTGCSDGIISPFFLIECNDMSDVSGYGRLVNGIYRKQLRNSVKISNLTIVTKNRKLW